MDEDGELSIPVNGGKHLTENFVGAHLQRYDSMLLLSHFKGHAMGGFGGALKNMSIGVASAHGKAHIHGVGVPENLWTADHDSFLECMAEADKAVMDYLGRENLLYINVANRLSVDCDCDSHPKEPGNGGFGDLCFRGPGSPGPGLVWMRSTGRRTPVKRRSLSGWSPGTASTR